MFFFKIKKLNSQLAQYFKNKINKNNFEKKKKEKPYEKTP
jgi:hypothetical protein